MKRFAPALLLVTGLFMSCAGSQPPPYSDGPVNIVYEMEGKVTQLSALRGRPVVLVLMRVNELTSELFIDHLVEAHDKIAGRTRFVVLSLDLNEAPMLHQFVEFHELSFPVGLAQGEVAQGMTGLGLIPVSPTTYFIGKNGNVEKMIPGVIPAETITDVTRRLGWK